MVTMSAGISGFYMSSFVIFVPIVEWILSGFGESISVYSWIAAVIGMIGLFLLSGCAETSCFSVGIPIGEVYLVIAMLSVVGIVMVNDWALKVVEPFSFTMMGYTFASIICIIVAISMETSDWMSFAAFRDNVGWLVLSAVCQSCVALLSILGQRYVKPTRAALILSLQGKKNAFISIIYDVYFILVLIF
jgi:drug/metabolite transporter (DMT)-like permease